MKVVDEKTYRAKCFADDLHDEFSGLGLDVDKVFSIFGEIENQQELQLVRTFFGVRPDKMLVEMFNHPLNEYSLDEFLIEGLASYHIVQLENALLKRGIILFEVKKTILARIIIRLFFLIKGIAFMPVKILTTPILLFVVIRSLHKHRNQSLGEMFKITLDDDNLYIIMAGSELAFHCLTLGLFFVIENRIEKYESKFYYYE